MTGLKKLMDRKEGGGRGASAGLKWLSAECLVSKDKAYAEKLFSSRLSQHL